MERTKSRTVKLEDLAREAKVSISTVSRALSGDPSVNTDTRKRILQIAKAQQYEAPPRRARSTVRTTNALITVVMAPPLIDTYPSIDPFSLSLLGGIIAAMRERELNLSISHAVPTDQRSVVQFIEQNPSDGFIFLGQSQLHAALNRLARDGRRFVVWGAAVEDQAYCSIGSDNQHGGQRATNHLIRLGRRRIAFVGDTHTIELTQRYKGYQAALLEAGLPVDPSLHRRCGLTPSTAVEAVDDLLDQRVEFDAIVAASDLIAVGAMRALSRRGIEVPKDVSVVGYDDIEIAAHTHPAMTTIRQDTGKAGRLLVAKILRLLAGDRASSKRLATELIVRESCGA